MSAAATFLEAFTTPIRDRSSEDDWHARIEALSSAPMTAEDVEEIRGALTQREAHAVPVAVALSALHRNAASSTDLLRADLERLRGNARVVLAAAAMRGPLAREAVDAVVDEVEAGLRSADVAFTLAEAVRAGAITSRGRRALRRHFDCADWLLRWHAAETLAYAAGARDGKDGRGGELFVNFAASPIAAFRKLAEDAAIAVEEESPFVTLDRSLTRGKASEAMRRFSESVVAAKAGVVPIDLDALAELEPDERLHATFVLAHQAVPRMEFQPSFPPAIAVFGTAQGARLPFANAIVTELAESHDTGLRDAARAVQAAKY